MVFLGQEEAFLGIDRHMYLPALVNGIPTSCLGDTGASAFAFVHERFARKNALPLVSLNTPISLYAFQGDLIQRITHTTRFTLQLSSHQESAVAYVITNCKHDLVLGLPWFERHRPHVDWAERSLAFSCCQASRKPVPWYNTTAEATAATLPTSSTSPEQPTADRASEQGHAHREATIPKGAKPEDYLPAHYHDFLDVFDAQAAATLPPHRPQDHAIDLLPGKSPPAFRPYPMTGEKLRHLREELDRMLSRGFIRPSRSSAAAPVLFAKKPGGGLRFCVDYRGLNEVTVKNRYSLPLVQETLTMLSDAQYFTKLDIIAAFNKIRIKEGDEWKTAFTTRYGLYEYLVVPFGLCNAPSTFQSYINEALAGYLDQFCTAYMDDILIFSADLESHRRHVRQVLQRLRKFGLQADISKCDFESKEVTYLGLIVSTTGTKMDPAKVSCVTAWPQPRNVKDVQSFLGFCNFYRRFIPRFSALAAPLTALTRKNVPFSWSSSCDLAFRELKAAFVSDSVLRHFDPTLPTVLETDASDYVVAAVLSQHQADGELHPVAFMSRKMTPPECNYDIYDKELLAVVAAFEAWPAELGSAERPVVIYSDHKNLEYFTTTKKLNRRQVRWSEFLSEFDFRIAYRPGRLNGKPDALTRIADDRPSDPTDPRELYQHQQLLKPSQFLRPMSHVPEEPDHPAGLWTPVEWQDTCATDELCQSVRQDLENPQAYRRDIELGSATLTEFSFAVKGCEYVPKGLQLAALSHFHEHPLSGHRGAAALFALISRTYWWPSLHKDCAKFARGCRSCHRNNPSTRQPHGLLQPLAPPNHPFRHLTLDFVGPLPISLYKGQHYRYILTVVDRLTKRSWFIPTEGMTAEETMQALVDNVFRFSGLPDSLVSDQGRTFIDSVWKATCDHLQIKHQLSTAYHPQTDGQSERMNRTVEVYLRHFVNYRQDDWSRRLPLAEFAINNHVNATTGYTPFFASFGIHPRAAAAAGPIPADFPPCPPLVNDMRTIHNQCQDAIGLAQAFQASYANQKRLPAPRYAVDDMVYLDVRHLRRSRATAKLDHIRAGPYRISLMKTPLVAKLDLPDDVLIDNNFHVSLLRPAPLGFPSQEEARPPPIDVTANEYVVEAILAHRYHRNRLQYRVKWRGYDDPSWEPATTLEDCQALDDYLVSLGLRLIEGGG